MDRQLERQKALLAARRQSRREEIATLGACVEVMARGKRTHATLADAVAEIARYEMENRA